MEGIDENLKIRKYRLTNRYIFHPRLIWLKPKFSSIISRMLLFLYSNANYQLSSGGGGINNTELSRDEGSLIRNKLSFDDLNSKKYLEDYIVTFKEEFPDDYNLIFNDNTIDDIQELSRYKMLIYPFTFSSKIVEEKYPYPRTFPSGKIDLDLAGKLFNKEYLSINKGFSKEFKNWVIMDKSVKPLGVVYESDSKQDCIDWINNW